MKATGATAVKLEGGVNQRERIEWLVRAGVPVMGHIGLQPQNVHVAGGYRVQRERQALLDDALSVAEAGAFAMVIECVSRELAAEVTRAVDVPTIGIGAGPGVNGQVLVTHDLIGNYGGHQAKFVRVLADVGQRTQAAAEAFVEAVRTGDYPSDDESFR